MSVEAAIGDTIEVQPHHNKPDKSGRFTPYWLMLPGMLWLAWEHPVAFFGALAVALLVMVSLTVALIKFLRRLLNRWRGADAEPQAGG